MKKRRERKMRENFIAYVIVVAVKTTLPEIYRGF